MQQEFTCAELPLSLLTFSEGLSPTLPLHHVRE